MLDSLTFYDDGRDSEMNSINNGMTLVNVKTIPVDDPIRAKEVFSSKLNIVKMKVLNENDDSIIYRDSDGLLHMYVIDRYGNHNYDISAETAGRSEVTSAVKFGDYVAYVNDYGYLAFIHLKTSKRIIHSVAVPGVYQKSLISLGKDNNMLAIIDRDYSNKFKFRLFRDDECVYTLVTTFEEIEGLLWISEPTYNYLGNICVEIGYYSSNGADSMMINTNIPKN